MADAAYTKLGNVLVDPDLTVDTPGGGRIRITSRPEDRVVVISCDSEPTLWEAYKLAGDNGLLSLDYRGLQQLRNPFLQTIEVVVDDRTLLEWAPSAYPRVRSLRGLLRVLRRRKG